MPRPTNLNYVIGDATNPVSPGNRIIAHCCNDAGWVKSFSSKSKADSASPISSASQESAPSAIPNPLRCAPDGLGTGLASGDWATIANIIQEELCSYGVNVTVYDLPDLNRPL